MVSGPRTAESQVPVVVTGLGLVTSAGAGVDSAWKVLSEGTSALSELTLFDPGPYGLEIAGESHSIERVPGQDRALQLLDLAADEVLGAAGWGDTQRGPETGVVLGTCQGAIESASAIHRSYASRPVPEPTDADRKAFAEYRPGFGTTRLAKRVGAEGPTSTVGMVCVSSSVALMHAVDLIRCGEARRVLAGGFEAFTQFVLTGFHCIGALASGPLRPFDQNRDGTVLAEGAVLMTLEREDDAIARGATILARVIGCGVAADAFHMTAPDPKGGGLERAVRQAFAEAGIGPADVDYISAHGTGTAFNDGMESVAFARIFKELADAGQMPPLTGVKSVFGHTLGAAGALDAAMAILAMRHGVLTPTVSHVAPLEGLEDWDFNPHQTRPVEGMDIVLSTNSAFGGNNSALLLQRAGV
ncbi:MAG: beta-ketoacyl-[acyl-carrier-protein] synthase family protein [Deltaproteobacteria bacterium]|nr:beta-ketoacyl-[acyl-carrier-protein] synthase family protein [Deltaproteobacteria bacterium]